VAAGGPRPAAIIGQEQALCAPRPAAGAPAAALSRRTVTRRSAGGTAPLAKTPPRHPREDPAVVLYLDRRGDKRREQSLQAAHGAMPVEQRAGCPQDIALPLSRNERARATPSQPPMRACLADNHGNSP
jgi:hypothetical protein